MSQIKLIVGLNNFEQQYKETRHNAGKWVLDAFADKHNLTFRTDKSLFGDYTSTNINGNKVHLLLPNTYMNASGKSVIATMNFYKIKPEEVLIIHDELALTPGHAKFKFGGGHNGHNGLKDIHRVMGTDKYWRLRIGIDHPGDKSKVIGHVLGKPTTDERELNQQAVEKSVKALDDIFTIGLDKVMNTFNQ